MSSHESVVKLLERSRKLRQRTDAMLADRRMQSLQPHDKVPSHHQRLEHMLHEIRAEVKDLQKEDASLMLQMQRLYSDMRKVSDQLSREPSLESVNDREDDGETESRRDGYPRSASACFRDDRRPSIRIDDEEHPVYGRLNRRRSMSTGNVSVFSNNLSSVTTSTTSGDGTEAHGDDAPDELCMCAECEEKRQATLCLSVPVRTRAMSAEPVGRRLSPIRRLLKAVKTASPLSPRAKRRNFSFTTDDVPSI